MEPLLKIKNLKTYFYTPDGIVKAVDGVSFLIHKGETFCIVGESGSGKTVTALSIMRLVQEPPGRIVNGEISYQGKDLLQLSETEMCHVRGKEISMIFQDPMTSLDPLYRVGHQIEEAIEWHLNLDRDARRKRTIDLMRRVGIADPERRAQDYPHQFSGGMIQRAMIAMALSCNPKILIADEPTTSLDVTIEAQVIELIREIQHEMNMGVIFVTHNMGIVAKIADRIAVMYAGNLVETGPSKNIFKAPKHPYTIGLMRSVPRPDVRNVVHLSMIEGAPPDLIDIPAICPFAPRCEFVVDKCWDERPELRNIDPSHQVACFVDIK